MDLDALRIAVENEIENYVYEIHPNAIGQPLPQEWVDAQLVEMRAALVHPIWRDVRIQDSYEQMMGQAEGEIRPCVLVADDREGYELYFDPAQGDFVLASSGNPPVTFNVRGDAVGCFMAR
jgi:hypothetical protein